MKVKEDKNFIYDRVRENNFFRRVRYFFYDIFYHGVLNINYYLNKNKDNKIYNVSICAIFKDEVVYLKEWLEFHLLIGVDHFYLYNNFSTDNYLEILKPYIEKNIVTLKEWPIKAGQLSAYDDCYNNYKNESQWICFLDIDEFICLYEEEDIKTWLKKFIKYPSVLVYWKMFGSSGKIERERELVIEEFYISWVKLVDIGKVFFNTNFKIKKQKIHFIDSEINIFGFKTLIPTMNEYRKFVKGGISRKGKLNTTIQINHYWSKTYNEYRNKKILRGDAFFIDRKRGLEEFYYTELKNKSSDYKIFRFLIRLKERYYNY